MHDARAPILWRVRAFYKPAPFQTVHGGCHRPTAEQHLLSKSVHRQRPFVQEGFENTEISQAQVFGFDAPMRWCFHRLRCLPQQQPEVNALPRFRLLALFGLHFFLFSGLLVAIAGGLLYARGSYLNYVGGALLFFVSGLFDEMDGMLARIKFRESAFGTWLEGSVDNITYLAVLAGITVALRRQYGSWPLKYGIALIIGCVLSVIVIGIQRTIDGTGPAA